MYDSYSRAIVRLVEGNKRERAKGAKARNKRIASRCGVNAIDRDGDVVGSWVRLILAGIVITIEL